MKKEKNPNKIKIEKVKAKAKFWIPEVEDKCKK